MLRLGLCCGFVSDDAPRFRATTVRYASTLEPSVRTRFLHEVAEHNVDALGSSIRWCAERGIHAFRITRGLLPLYTHPVVGWSLTGPVGPDYARGHPAATGGSVTHDEFERLLRAIADRAAGSTARSAASGSQNWRGTQDES